MNHLSEFSVDIQIALVIQEKIYREICRIGMRNRPVFGTCGLFIG